MRHKAHAIKVSGTGNHKDEMEEKWSPADNEDSQKDSQGDGCFHAGSLVDGVVAWQSGDAFDVRTCQHEHVTVKGGHEC